MPVAASVAYVELFMGSAKASREPCSHSGEATSDDETFATLRRKLKRWSDDNAVVLKDAKPIFPAGF
ncbi:MAG: hypothetical protein ACLQFW_12260 [Xanthobacteraceae bacterium]